MNFAEIFEIFTDLSVPIAAIITSICALKGLNSWRNQLIGKDEYEISVKLLKETIRLRDQITESRKRAFREYETKENKESSENKNSTKISNGLSYRIKKLSTVNHQFESLLIEAEVFLGNEFIKQTIAISDLVKNYISDTKEYIECEEDEWSILKYQRGYKKTIEEKIFLDHGNVDKEIEEVFKKIDSEIRKNM